MPSSTPRVTALDSDAGPVRHRFSILLSYAKPHRGTLVFVLVLALLNSGMSLASPMATKWVLDALAAGTSLLDPILLLCGLLVVGTAVGWWQWVVMGTLAETIVYDARAGMIIRFFAARIQQILGRPVGELVTRVTSDSVLLREAASSSLIGLINGVIMLLGSLALMAVLDLPLLLTTAAAVAIVVALFSVLMPGIAKAQERSQAALGTLGGKLEGGLRAIKTVKAAVAEDRVQDALLDEARTARRHSITSVRLEALVYTISFAGLQAAIIVILGFGAWRVAQGDLSVSALIAFLLYAFGLVGPIMEVATNLSTLQSGVAAAGRIRELDTLVPEPGLDDDAKSASSTGRTGQTGISFQNISAGYGTGALAVDDISLDIPARGHTAIVGPSGAGKTTVLSLLLRFLDPQSGQILIDGEDTAGMSPARLRRRFAYVEQETPVVPGTIRENLTFSHPQADDEEIRGVLDSLNLSEAVDALPEGWDTPLHETSVSGGQRQRIALARALLSDPEYLLLDEATAQVDGVTEAAVQETISRAAAGGAVITIAHRLSTVIDADQILVMQGGHIVDRGTHAELLRSSRLYADLVEALRISTSS